MKNRNVLFRFMMWMIAITSMTACSDQQEYPEAVTFSGDEIPLSMRVARYSAGSSVLQYGLYVFSRPTQTTENYQLDSVILPLTETSRLKFSNAELSRKEYRFLFIATPGDETSLKVVNTEQGKPVSGTTWENIRIIQQGDSISIDNYYQVTDRSAQDLLATDTLYGHLSRMVGQMVFRFVKIGENITDAQLIDLNKVTSIFDRIKNIRVEYENYTSAIAFDEQGIPRPESISASGSHTISQNITTVLENYRLNLPQPGLVPVNGDAAEGGEIRGYCFLPASQQIHTTLTFTYYDTTPTCEETTHQHIDTCYSLQTLVLDIPENSLPGLSVESNAYTVNKAGIRCNRIIDIGTTHNIEINTEWK